MQTTTLLQQKKELAKLEKKDLVDLCIRLAKYKKENKELLNYLLYDAYDPLQYAEQVKFFLEIEFSALQKNYYYSTKSLRKILRQIIKNIKYTGSKQVEIELLIWFCTNFLNFADTRTSHKPLQGILTRQLDKIIKLIPKLHEDLQFDYQTEFDKLIAHADKKVSWLNKSSYITSS